MMKRNNFSCLFLVLIILNSNIIFASNNSTEGFFFTLTLVANPLDQSAEYASLVANYLRDIKIKVDIQYYNYCKEKGLFQNWDLLFEEYSTESFDMREMYTENGNLNIFGLNRNIPYCDESENAQYEALSISDLDDRHQLYRDWSQLFMDKILPLLPFFSPRHYEAFWAKMTGYDMRWGLPGSLPYMNYEGLHEGQDSLDELNIADKMWEILNPLFSRDKASGLVIDLISEPLLQWSPDNAPVKTGLIDDWEEIRKWHYKFYMRDNLFWNPSYNTTVYGNDSIPLETFPLMDGIKGENSNGTNQQITAKDAVFSLLVYANNLLNTQSAKYYWLTDCYVDRIDPLSFHVKIDGDPITSENEVYYDFFKCLSIPILPEFFLNSTSDDVSYTSGGIKCYGLYPNIIDTPQWKTYDESAFSCGKYMLYYTDENSITVLQRSPYWFGIGAIDRTRGMQPFVERINIRCIPNIKEALMEFKAGKLDLMDVTEFPRERKMMQADTRFEVQLAIQDYFPFLAFNMRRPIIGGLDNHIFLNKTGKEEYTKALAVRKAICYAIDREEIGTEKYNGDFRLQHYPMRTIYFYFYPPDVGIITYLRDLDLAWEWMEAAGYQKPETAKNDFFSGLLALLTITLSLTLVLKLKRRRKG